MVQLTRRSSLKPAEGSRISGFLSFTFMNKAGIIVIICSMVFIHAWPSLECIIPLWECGIHTVVKVHPVDLGLY